MQKDQYDLGQIYFALCKSVDSPCSLAAWMKYKYGEHSALVSSQVNPADYTCADDFQLDYGILSFVKKFTGLKTGIDTRAVALLKLKQSEARCREFNVKLKNPLPRNVEGVLLHARRLACSILGPLNVAQMLERCKWGPGATSSIRRDMARIDNKINEFPMSVTRQALPYLRKVIGEDIHWGRCFVPSCDGQWSPLPVCFQVVESNRVVTVPKDARGDRVISAEPTGNTFLQQGVGRYLRKRLKRFGVNLDDQRINQSWAEYALPLGLATLDLSSASDSICTELVAQLLPLDWFLFLDDLRSHKSKLDGIEFHNERFSSMGNAFTFELETLIFYCLTKAVVNESGKLGTVSVYGDDIVVNAELFDRVVDVFEEVGFVINREKSFAEGVFRESCGKHYFNGTDVTPPYQKHVLDSPSELIRCHNRLYRWAWRCGLGMVLDKRIRPAILAAKNQIEDKLSKVVQPFGSDGDFGFLSLESELTFPCPTGNYSIQLPSIEPITKKVRVENSAVYAWSLRRGVVVPVGSEPFDAKVYDQTGALVWSDCTSSFSPGRAKLSRRRYTPSWEFGASWA